MQAFKRRESGEVTAKDFSHTWPLPQIWSEVLVENLCISPIDFWGLMLQNCLLVFDFIIFGRLFQSCKLITLRKFHVLDILFLLY